MEARSSSFEEVAFALFQALNPGKKLNRDQIPYKQLRGLVGELVGDHRTQCVTSPTRHPLTSNGSSSLLNGEEKNGTFDSSTFDVSDDSSSRISFEESSSTRSRSMLRAVSTSKKVCSTTKAPKHTRGMVQIRARRRKASYTPRYIPFECTEEELRAGFSSFYERLLDSCATSTECYHVLINTLNNFFTHNTWTNNVEKLVNEFMYDNVLLSCAELGAKYDRCGESGSGGRRLREYELMTLLEIRILGENCTAAVEESDVLNKLRFIYFATDVQRLRAFLDETISDQFAHVKPLVVTRIYEELCMKLPFDLQVYARVEIKNAEEDFESENAAVLQRRISQTENLVRLISGNDSDESTDCPSTSTANPERHRRSTTERSFRHAYKNQHLITRAPSKIRKNESWEGSSEPKAEKHQLLRRSFSVPETPESKMKRKRLHPDANKDDKNPVVPQTPVAKMNRYANGRRSRPLIAVLKESEEGTTAAGSKPSSSGVGLLMKCTKKKTSQMNLCPSSFLPTPSQQSPPLSSSRPPTRSQSGDVVKINLQQKFAKCNAEAINNDMATLPQPSSSRGKGKGEFSLERGVVERYRRRLDNIRHSARKTDKNEIFYGRCTSRRNLFDDEESGEGVPSGGVATRSSSCATLQKNRSGRSVHTNCVYMAHALLNVHNTQPLTPSKAPKQSPFKLHRLVRPASKSDRRRLSKLRIRIQRERIGMPAAVLNAHAAEESPQSPSEH